MDFRTVRTGAGAAVVLLSMIPALPAVADIAEGHYNIVSRHSGLALDVAGGSTGNGANIQQWALNDDSANQQFEVSELSNGYYSIRALHSGKSVDVFNFSTRAGGEIRQWSWNGGPQQQWRIDDSGNGFYSIVSRHSGMALDVWEWSTNSGGDIRQWPVTGNLNQQWRFQPVAGDEPDNGSGNDGGSGNDDSPDGDDGSEGDTGDSGGGNGNPGGDEGNDGGDTGGDGGGTGGDNVGTTACLAEPVGYASLGGGTTGGAGGTEITVSTGLEFLDALSRKSSGTPLTIRVDGTINLSNSGANKLDVKNVSDVSIIGVGDRGLLDGIGIKIWRANNIIVRNLTIRYVSEGDGDGISIESPSNNVWIDHNTLHNSLDVDKDYYDGLLDAKRDANNISVTYNYLHNSWKTSLSGHSDSESSNNRSITYAFNRWENVYSRTPLIRFSDTHLYNNYYNRILDTGINSRMGAQVRIENNVFEDSKNPIVSCYSSSIGYWYTRNNQFDNAEWKSSGDCVLAGPSVTPTTRINPPYDYSLLPTNQVKEHVVRSAGAGQCNL